MFSSRSIPPQSFNAQIASIITNLLREFALAIQVGNVCEMFVWRDKRSSYSQGTYRNHEIGKGRPFPGPAELPSERAHFPPHPDVCRNLGKNVEERFHPFPYRWRLQPTQNLRANDPGTVESPCAQMWQQDLTDVVSMP